MTTANDDNRINILKKMMLTGEPRAWRLKGSEDGKLLHLVEEKSLVQFDMDMKDVANIMVESIEQ